MSYQILQGDCLTHMARLPDGSIDAIIADPPYLTTNLHFDKAPSMDWAVWWAEAWRVVKPSGVVVLFAADLFTVDLILTQRPNYRYRLVWCKTMGTGFLDAERRPLRAHEDVLLFSQKPSETTYNPQKTPGAPYKSHRKDMGGHYGSHTVIAREYDGARHPLSLLFFGSEPTTGRLHPTQKPTDLMRWLVRTYTNAGDTVLDCFAGSGSTGHACLLEDRKFIGCEVDPVYYAKAQQRLQQVAAAPQLFSPVTT